MRALTQRIDPSILAFALVTAVGVLVIQEGAELALLCAVSVVLVGMVAEPIVRRVVPPSPGLERRWYAPLTPREAEVALAIADGLSNKEIAARLGIGERGVETHVFNISNKLTVHNRTQIALWIKEKQRQAAAGSPPKKSVPT
jgi:DNA-binding NarL/FixJ family response regulator